MEWDATERARAGIFMAFQRPMAIPGVKMADFLRHATTNVRNPDRKEGEQLIPMREFRKELREKMSQLRMDEEFARRYVNDGFSGGEMKRAEILQMAMLRPKFAILDETDSGLDVDAVKLASQSIAEIGGAEMGILIITHHDRLLEHNMPDFTHVMLGGRIVETGGVELARELYTEGYDRIRDSHPEDAAVEKEMAAASKTEPKVAAGVAITKLFMTPAANAAVKDQKIMATDLITRSRRTGAGRNQQVRLRHADARRVQSPPRIERTDRLRNLGDEARARVDARLPAAGR